MSAVKAKCLQFCLRCTLPPHQLHDVVLMMVDHAREIKMESGHTSRSTNKSLWGEELRHLHFLKSAPGNFKMQAENHCSKKKKITSFERQQISQNVILET